MTLGWKCNYSWVSEYSGQMVPILLQRKMCTDWNDFWCKEKSGYFRQDAKFRLTPSSACVRVCLYIARSERFEVFNQFYWLTWDSASDLSQTESSAAHDFTSWWFRPSPSCWWCGLTCYRKTHYIVGSQTPIIAARFHLVTIQTGLISATILIKHQH